MFNIVLVEPEIPANTGNIARTCAAAGLSLHLVEPLGFSISDKHLKRAGLDYWHLLDVHVYKNLETFFSEARPDNIFLFTTKAARHYNQCTYPAGAWFLFGKETKGLPEDLLAAYPEQCLRLPMREEARSLNLSNTVAVVAFEALRQHGYPGLR